LSRRERERKFKKQLIAEAAYKLFAGSSFEVVTVEDIESVGVVAGAMMGAALGNKNVYLVRRGSPSHVIPGSVIMSLTAYMNGNVLDLAVPLSDKMRILKV